MKLTTSQALMKFLNQQYIEIDGHEQKLFKGIFTIFGHGNVLGIGQALEEDSGDLEVYQGRSEQGMAHAAAAFAKQTGHQQLMACTTSVGPGSANMVTAAATATANNIPILLIPGDTFASRQPDPVLQQIEQPHDSTISTNDAFKPVSKYWDRITRPEQLMTALIQAMRVLTRQADTGAVTIAIPQDVQAEAYDFPAYFFDKRVHRFDKRKPDDRALDRVVELIANKKKPLIICGGGVRYSDAGKELAKFTEKYQIPFAETQAGKSAVISDHPMNLGGIGVTGNFAANQIAKEADVIIGIGTRFTDFTTSSKHLFQHQDVEFVTINNSAYHASKLDAHPLVADAKVAIEQLDQQLAHRQYQTEYSDEISKIKRAWQQEVERLSSIQYVKGLKPEVEGHLDEELAEYEKALNTSLTQTQAIGVIQQHIADDAIIVGSSGSLPGDLQRMWINRKPNTYHLEYGYSCMGYEISGSLGVKLASPDQEVYAMVGDGSYLMLHSELITSVQEGQKINVLLFDNAGFGCINNLQMDHGMGSFGTEFRKRDHQTKQLTGEIMAISYAQSAAAYGVKTYTATNAQELVEALEDAKHQSISTLIDIKVLPKTMTHGYDAWWNVGVAEVAKKPVIEQAAKERQVNLAAARKY
ncbi:3D-(3,5/4)-trihydroxycyclohexane-1,2-dione acylhydrolase (decyclizing) [Gracilibacillus dipsosauri]|uniref:3D-(3,5/4)-trihydroxycyclohexane-1,2-dione acylhydrolase (Decyclizing) n=2 Tax=Gracilibacillus dipsosauri TaxID=178340 RepID=A0A317L4L9_9BACI|nr:3D-(3,5/4)-trihydroxycyclohexane-1,2-dione acylhydrolase (decyclizing) [Gracilibacillus dipsosauri]PWU69930.1 3D-(3,5/4)-trihydroxycyclohexane-1,2-dione acylhydrolase (decyclizing) [Gracilibacillus dipsosauri]